MSALKTTHPLALGLLLSEEIYRVQKDLENRPSLKATAVPENEAAMTIPAEKQEEAVVFDYLGDNNRYWLLLVKEPQCDIIQAPHLDSLKSILGALKMELTDVTVLNVARYPGLGYNQLRDFFACSRTVLFGIDPAEIGLAKIPANEITVISGDRILATFSFAEMLEDTGKKRIFWNQIKQL